MKNRDLLRRNKLYSSTYQQMLAYQQAYLGGVAFKQNVRRKRPSEDSVLYLDLISNSVAQPLCRYIVDTINDVLFEPGVKRELRFCTPAGDYIDPANTEWVDLFTLDADLQNRSMTGFMEQVGDLTSIFGHCWVSVDMPRKEEGSLGRPYCVALSPLDVWDWEWTYFGGKPLLKYVKVKEMETAESYYIKCYYLGDEETPSYWRLYEVDKGSEANKPEADADLEAAGYFPPGMSLPIFIAYGRRDPRVLDLGISDIDAATDAQREHYKLECEAYTSLQFAKTIIRADKGVAIPVHAGAVVRATQGQVEAIPIDTGDVDKIIAKQNDILENLEALTGLGGLRNSKNQVASGISIIEERKTLHRLAKAKARMMEVIEETIFTYAARFMDMRWAGEINYNTDYEAYDQNYRLALMQQAKQLVPAGNAIIDNLIIKEIIGMLAPAHNIPEYEQAFINTIQDPAVKTLMTQDNNQVMSRDLASQIPVEEVMEEIEPGLEEENDDEDNGESPENAALMGGAGTPIAQVGMTYQPTQAVAVQIAGLNVGR